MIRCMERYPSHGDRIDPDADAQVDLAAVQADDALITTLGAGQPVSGDIDAELARVLAAWRRDLESEPFGELVDPDGAVASTLAALRAGHPAEARRPPDDAAAQLRMTTANAGGAR